jgi:acyl-CoA thioesterase-1
MEGLDMAKFPVLETVRMFLFCSQRVKRAGCFARWFSQVFDFRRGLFPNRNRAVEPSRTLHMFRRLIIIALASFLAVTNANAQIVALGASSTAGYGVGASSAYPAQLEAMLRAKGRPMSVSNAGVSGDTTGGMLARLSSAVPQGTRIVILQIAGNDAMKGMSPVNAAANRAEIRRQLHARGIRTIEADGYVQSAVRSGLRQADGIHMTAEGHRRVAEQLAASIR